MKDLTSEERAAWDVYFAAMSAISHHGGWMLTVDEAAKYADKMLFVRRERFGRAPLKESH